MSREARILVSVLCLLAVALSASSAAAAPSDPDLGFGTGGTVQLTHAAFPTLNIGALAVQPDGKVLVGGNDSSVVPAQATLLRLNADGSLDTTFGSGGHVTISNADAKSSRFSAIYPQADGTIIAAGAHGTGGGGGTVVVRFSATGAVDAGYGNPAAPDGESIDCPYPTASGGAAQSIVPMPDGGVAVLVDCADTGSSSEARVYRFDANGAWESSWSGDGMVIIQPNPTGYTTPASMFLDGAGRVVVVGKYDLPGGHRRGFAQRFFASDGQKDNDFGVSGLNAPIDPPTTPVNYTDFDINAGVGLADGRTLLVGSGATGMVNPDATWAFAELGSDGFQHAPNDQVQMVSPGATIQRARDIVVLPGLGTVTGGRSQIGGHSTPLLIGRDFNGAPMPGFGSGGTLQYSSSTITDDIVDLAVAPDGKLLVSRAEGNDLDIYRYIGAYVPPTPTTPTAGSLKARITTPRHTRNRARKARRIAGTASGPGLKRVQIAILRVDSRLLKKHRRCQWVTSSKGKLRKYKARHRKCGTPSKWLSAKGTTRWSYRLKRSLRPGRYTVYVRAQGSSGYSTVAHRSLRLTR